jgi:hypothetical protein
MSLRDNGLNIEVESGGKEVGGAEMIKLSYFVGT